MDFKDLSLEEQLKWIEKQTERVVKRLPSLKKNLSTYNDVSAELYNLEPEDIMIMSKTHQKKLTSGTTDTSTYNFARKLEMYGDTPMETLRATATEKRIESFLDYVDNATSEEESEYVHSLIDKMSDEDKEEFTKSKYFWFTSDYPSDELVKFNELYKGAHESISPATANLETFMKKKGYDTDNWYDYDRQEKNRGGNKWSR